MSCSVRLLLSFMLCALATSSAVAQINTGEIRGVVTDSSGGVLPGATVTATHAASGLVVERTTDAEGRFFLPALRIGQWAIAVTLSGFSQTDRTIVLEVGRTLELELSLGVQRLAEEVSVVATAPLLQTSNAEISDVIENREVVQLPINGRNLMSLAQLSDSVVIPPGGTRGEALQQAGPLPNVGGQRSGHNIYLLDGTKVTDELFNNLVINPSIDSVEEFKIQKSMYSAEFGGKASALINVVTKSGGNQFRGSLFEFHRNDAFDSANYFQPKDQPLPPLKQNQFGGSIGGPIVRSRSFLFGSFEGQRMNRSLTRTFSVPTDAVRGGNFAGMSDDLRSVDDPDDRRLHAVCEQPHSRRSHRSAGPRVPQERRVAHVERRDPELDFSRRRRTETSISSACVSITGSPMATTSSRASARSTPTSCSRSVPARCRRRWSRVSAET